MHPAECVLAHDVHLAARNVKPNTLAVSSVDFQLSLASEGVGSAYPDQPLAASANESVGQVLQLLRAQRTGGCLLFNVSKQALNPGPAFGPYGLPKAATLALMRQYAVDYGGDGIRANAVNADRIRSGLLTPMVAERAKARVRSFRSQ